uniref:CBM20 domain-containing protein n=1 Tax=Guillardia theta TaxID=55529 RepID=A0A7S4NZU8_GUITH
MLIQQSQTEKSPNSLLLPPGLRYSTRLRLRGGGIFDCFGCKRAVQASDRNSIELIVHFEAREGSEVSYTPAVVGSGDLLGKWDIRKALVMTKGPGELRWSRKISVPRADESYEFKYILIPDRTCAGSEGVLEEVLWEDGPNRAFSTRSNGQIEISSAAQLPHHIRHEINGAPPCVDVCFSVHHKTESASEYISVVGSCEVLGNWDPSKAVPLLKGHDDKLGRTRWERQISLPFPNGVEFKFLIFDSSKRTRTIWEAGTNRVCSISREGCVSFHPDSTTLYHCTELPESEAGKQTAPDMKNENVTTPVSRVESFQKALGRL